jgi:hypothetical protein
VAIEIRQTKRAIVYRVIVPSGAPGADPVIRTFRSKAAAQAWEREMLHGRQRCDEAPKG